MRELFEKLGLDPEAQTPGRQVVHHLGESLVQAMEMAQQGGTPEAAELVACECVVLAEKSLDSIRPIRMSCIVYATGLYGRSVINESGIYSAPQAAHPRKSSP